MKYFFEWIRVEAWISKFPPFFLTSMLILLAYDDISYQNYLLVVIAVIAHFISGYTLNDIADWESDIAGKDERIIHKHSKIEATTYGLGFLSLHLLFLGFLFLKGYEKVAGGAVLLLILHLVYSIPPRFKDMGLVSIFSSSFNQWIAPFILFILMFKLQWTEEIILLTLWLLLMGLSGAVRHQIHDFERDKNNVRNFIQKVNKTRGFQILRIIQYMTFLAPALFFLVFNVEKALVYNLVLSSFGIYHVLYYKRLKTY